MSKAGKSKERDVEAAAALRAFEATLRAACRARGTDVPRRLLQQLQGCQQQARPCEQVVLPGPCSGELVAAVTEALASYPRVTRLVILEGSVGDRGLVALAALLRASGSKWWHGSCLQALELRSDGQQPAPPAPAAVATTEARAPTPALAAPPAAGLCPPVPAHLQVAQLHSEQPPPPARLLPLQYRLHAPRPMLEVTAWALEATLGPGMHEAAPGGRPASAAAQGGAGMHFSVDALQQLSLALGVSGLCLAQLSLDSTPLGDAAGMSALARGLAACGSLRTLSLRGCGIDAAGMRELAAALAGGSNPAVAGAAQGRSSDGLAELQLSSNPLGNAGLLRLAELLRHGLPSLRVLGVASIGAECDQLAELASAIAAGPAALVELDCAANPISDEAAVHFLRLLAAKPSLLLLKLSPRLSAGVMAQLAAAMDAHQRVAPRAAKRGKGKK